VTHEPLGDHSSNRRSLTRRSTCAHTARGKGTSLRAVPFRVSGPRPGAFREGDASGRRWSAIPSLPRAVPLPSWPAGPRRGGGRARAGCGPARGPRPRVEQPRRRQRHLGVVARRVERSRRGDRRGEARDLRPGARHLRHRRGALHRGREPGLRGSARAGRARSRSWRRSPATPGGDGCGSPEPKRNRPGTLRRLPRTPSGNAPRGHSDPPSGFPMDSATMRRMRPDPSRKRHGARGAPRLHSSAPL
jgi:hypothetical protein